MEIQIIDAVPPDYSAPRIGDFPGCAEVMESPEPTLRLGDVLTQNGLVTEEEIQQALKLSRDEKIRLGAALMRMGVVDEDKIQWALGIQFQLTYVDLDEDMIDWGYLLGLPLDQLRELLLVPMGLIDNTVHAVVADPTTDGVMDGLERIFPGREVILQLASSRNINAILHEAGLRQGAEPQPATGEEDKSLVLSQWLEALESGLLEEVVVFPEPSRENLYHVRLRPESIDAPHSMSQHDFDTLVETITGHRSRELVPVGSKFLLEPGNIETRKRPVRIVIVCGLAGSLIALEGISLEGSTAGNGASQPVILMGEDPSRIKQAVLEEASALGNPEEALTELLISIESRVDSMISGIFQAEIPLPAERAAILHQLVQGARPRAMIVEAETASELRGLGLELSTPRPTPILILLRTPIKKEEENSIPTGVRTQLIDGDFDSMREQVRKILQTGE